MNPKRVLGRGLSALIPEADNIARLGDREVRLLGVDVIDLNPAQPRKIFDDNKLQDLARSIEKVGVLQPILVRRLEDGASGSSQDGGATAERFLVVAGERRLRAARLAEIREIPAIVCTFQETESLRIALLENLQREDLGPLEEAGAFRELLDAYGATQEEAAEMLGISRSSVANSLRLLTLEPEIRALLETGDISRGHAKVLLGLPEGPGRVRLAQLCKRKGLSVRDCEKRVQEAIRQRPQRARRRRRAVPEIPEIRALRERAERLLGSAVRISRNPKSGKGTLAVDFFSDADLERLLQIIGVDTNLT